MTAGRTIAHFRDVRLSFTARDEVCGDHFPVTSRRETYRFRLPVYGDLCIVCVQPRM
jgi:hypothetical protein